MLLDYKCLCTVPPLTLTIFCNWELTTILNKNALKWNFRSQQFLVDLQTCNRSSLCWWLLRGPRGPHTPLHQIGLNQNTIKCSFWNIKYLHFFVHFIHFDFPRVATGHLSVDGCSDSVTHPKRCLGFYDLFAALGWKDIKSHFWTETFHMIRTEVP